MYTIAQESFSSAQPGIQSLARMHWDEVETTSLPFRIDWDLLQALADANSLVCISVRDDANKFVGYALYIISPMTHSAGCTSAVCDSLYIRPQDRLGSLGIRFLRESESILREAGVDLVVQNVRNSSLNLEGVLAYLGYDHDGLTYVKEMSA